MTFVVGSTYYDAIGRKWTIIHAAKIKDEWVFLVKEDKWITKNYRFAIQDDPYHATVLLDDGFTTIYSDDEMTT